MQKLQSVTARRQQTQTVACRQTHSNSVATPASLQKHVHQCCTTLALLQGQSQQYTAYWPNKATRLDSKNINDKCTATMVAWQPIGMLHTVTEAVPGYVACG